MTSKVGRYGGTYAQRESNARYFERFSDQFCIRIGG
jgi:hypothetical protein